MDDYNAPVPGPTKLLLPALLAALLAACPGGPEEPGAEARALYARGGEALQRGDTGQALADFKTAADLAPDWTEAWQALAVAAWLTHDYAAFMRAAEELLERDPEDAHVTALLVEVALLAGDAGTAGRAVERLRGLRPQAPKTLLLAARLAFELGELGEAGVLARRASERDASLAEAHHIEGRVHEERGNTAAAAQAYRRALATDPGHQGARDAQASLLARLGHPAEAEAHRRLHGAVAAATERHFRARPAAERAETFGALVAELPRWVQGQVELGRALLERGDLPGAEAALKRALELDPGHPAAHQLYGRVLLRQERPKAAELHFQHALSLGR